MGGSSSIVVNSDAVVCKVSGLEAYVEDVARTRAILFHVSIVDVRNVGLRWNCKVF